MISASKVTTCSCVATDGGAAWNCETMDDMADASAE
jgi:hypothetical protein